MSLSQIVQRRPTWLKVPWFEHRWKKVTLFLVFSLFFASSSHVGVVVVCLSPEKTKTSQVDGGRRGCFAHPHPSDGSVGRHATCTAWFRKTHASPSRHHHHETIIWRLCPPPPPQRRRACRPFLRWLATQKEERTKKWNNFGDKFVFYTPSKWRVRMCVK